MAPSYILYRRVRVRVRVSYRVIVRVRVLVRVSPSPCSCPCSCLGPCLFGPCPFLKSIVSTAASTSTSASTSATTGCPANYYGTDCSCTSPAPIIGASCSAGPCPCPFRVSVFSLVRSQVCDSVQFAEFNGNDNTCISVGIFSMGAPTLQRTVIRTTVTVPGVWYVFNLTEPVVYHSISCSCPRSCLVLSVSLCRCPVPVCIRVLVRVRVHVRVVSEPVCVRVSACVRARLRACVPVSMSVSLTGRTVVDLGNSPTVITGNVTILGGVIVSVDEIGYGTLEIRHGHGHEHERNHEHGGGRTRTRSRPFSRFSRV